MSLIVPLLDAFEREGISYVVVGGLAVLLHGHERLTGDVDFVIRLNRENVLKAVGVLESLGYKSRVPEDPKGIADPDTRKRWIDEKGMLAFSFYQKDHPVFGVDVLVDYPMEFEGLLKRSILKPLGDAHVRVIGLDDLIEIKKKAGRPKDLEDVRWLEGIKRAQQR